ncbi:MAG: cysteine--tRNA ligase [Trueperaceae bacterium]|jgi:cysteinyl-tRNA synthetase|nr:cysteine--tRNA ligase [Trueperaceae bacterium]
MPLEFYNTLSRSKEEFRPVVPGHVGIYMCGPTVYSEPHLGHARGPVVFDVLRNWLEHEGYVVRFVSNVTDVGHLVDDADDGEDKLTRRGRLERLEPMEVAEKYFWSYFDAMAAMGVRRPSIVPRASGHIIEQQVMTSELIDRGAAYERDGSVYFDVSSWPDYGKLSGRDPAEQLEGTRVEVRSDKDDPRDFALWKRAEGGHIMRWPSPWSDGFPGWHIECSAMSVKYLGDEFDIHGGGLDLVFPHHEAELAQAQAAGKPFARVWLHWNMITLQGEKMAKSKGHFVTLAELFAAYDPIVVRLHLLRSHYRSASDFSEVGITSTAQGLKRLRETYRAATLGLADANQRDDAPFAEYRARFAEAMNDDLNTPQAIAVLFDAARAINRNTEAGADDAYRAGAGAFLREHLTGVLGVPVIDEAPSTAGDALAGVVELLLEERQLARDRRDFGRADALRDRLGELGVSIEDTPDGSRWKLG